MGLKNHGGKREGAGRKPGTSKKDKKQRITIRLHPEMIEKLENVDNKSQFIAEAVDEKMKRRENMKNHYDSCGSKTNLEYRYTQNGRDIYVCQDCTDRRKKESEYYDKLEQEDLKNLGRRRS